MIKAQAWVVQMELLSLLLGMALSVSRLLPGPEPPASSNDDDIVSGALADSCAHVQIIKGSEVWVGPSNRPG